MNELCVFRFSAPLGTETKELNELFDFGLKPVLDLLESKTDFRSHLSFSGEFLERLNKVLLRRIIALSENGQCEILAEAFYDPLFPHCADKEIIEQLQLSLDYWRSNGLKKEITGLWLGQHWKAGLADILSSSTFRYLFIDESLVADRVKNSLISHKKEANSILLIPCEKDLSQRGVPAIVYEYSSANLLPHGSLKSLEAKIKNLSACVLGTSFLTKAESGKAFLESEDILNNQRSEKLPEIAEAKRAYSRLLKLSETIEELPNIMLARPNKEFNKEKLVEAKRYFRKANSAELFRSDKQDNATFRYAFRRALFDSIISSQVEADVIVHPEIDPLHGWLDIQIQDYDSDGKDEVIIDSQLKTLFFKPSLGGALVNFDYKPRKLNLTNTLDEKKRNLCCVDALVSFGGDVKKIAVEKLLQEVTAVSCESTQAVITRQTLDLAGLRFSRELTSPGTKFSAQLVKHLAVKAGIGAHMNNATTGFSFEFWLEGPNKPPPETFLVSQWCFMLPSGNPDMLSYRPLTSFGGAAERALPFRRPNILGNSDVEAGLHGLRLIDGLESFIMEIRSAKPINYLASYPLFSETESEKIIYNGNVFLLLFAAERFMDDTKSNTIFLSIQ